ncbi:major facilitator superfamily domain-containing protein [Naematelia encephala]|uniref:Major facilitator superfamily domain-containing protein n=1 Tax=Naematelia encephala TaxID=71784 RepID=A0A1Y2B2I0_9TREE|nr:major facilitator superfamily domain-containing protein [Naematelia encephala]
MATIASNTTLGVSLESGIDNTAMKKPENKTWLGAIWDTADLPTEERKLMFKVDCALLTFACLGYFLKNIDQSNINNAFLSGMKEDLGMYGNQLVHAQSLWTAGYVIGQIPCNLILSKVSPRFVIPGLELIWGSLTLATYSVKNVNSLYAIRFLVGLFEAGYFPGIIMILGNWYTPRELAKRTGIFWAAGILGGMFSGFMQSAAYTNLSGVNGLAGWRWLFIIDAICTLPIAVLGVFVLPDEPFSGKPRFWLSKKDILLAQDRLNRIGRKGKAKWSWATMRRIGTSWVTYVLPLMYMCFLNGEINNPMGYWLKSFNAIPPPVAGVSYTVSQINLLPLPATAMFALGLMFFSWISDYHFSNRRYVAIYAGALSNFVFAMALRFLPTYSSRPAHFFLYYMAPFGNGGGPSIFAWTNELCGSDLERRAFTTALTNNFSYIMNAIAPNFVWATTDFPAAHKGLEYMAVLQVFLALFTTAAWYFSSRDKILSSSEDLDRAEVNRSPSDAEEGTPTEAEDEKDEKVLLE